MAKAKAVVKVLAESGNFMKLFIATASIAESETAGNNVGNAP